MNLIRNLARNPRAPWLAFVVLFTVAAAAAAAGEQTPFNKTPIRLPGRIQAEDFDRGGEGVAFHDTTPGNTGEDYRPDSDVDIDRHGTEEFHLAWIEPGEWLEYTVDIASAFTARVDFHVASGDNGGRFHVELDGRNLTGEITAPRTGSWWQFATVHVPEVPLPAGRHVLRFASDSAGYNLDWIGIAVDDGTVTRSVSGLVVPFQSSTASDTPSTGAPMEKLEYDRKIEFSGYTWSVKKADVPVGPGNNLFSDRPEDVWVDDQGLHLTVTQRDGAWWCTEVVIHGISFGYGTYVFHTTGRVDLLDPFVVAGMFTWDNYGDAGGRWPFRELDVEFARWGSTDDPRNAQFTVQPWDGEGTSHRFHIDLSDGDTALTLVMRWKQDRAEFEAYHGNHLPANFPADQRITSWSYSGEYLQPPGRENVRINLWSFLGKPPMSGERQELTVTRFAFFPPDHEDLVTD